MKNIIYIATLLIIQMNLTASLVDWNDKEFKERESQATQIFVGQLWNIERTYYKIENNKKVLVDFNDVIKHHNQYMTEGNVKFIKFKYTTTAMIFVGEILKGNDFQSGTFISLTWDDMFDSMCPHRKSMAVLKEKLIWHSDHDYNENKNRISTIPFKYLPNIKKIIIKNKK